MQIPEDLKQDYDRLLAEKASDNGQLAVNMIERIARLEAENKRLSEASDQFNAGWKSCIEDLRKSAEICRNVEAQNAKLIEALEKIGDKADGYADDSEDGLRGLRFRELSKQARAALQQATGKES